MHWIYWTDIKHKYYTKTLTNKKKTIMQVLSILTTGKQQLNWKFNGITLILNTNT